VGLARPAEYRDPREEGNEGSPKDASTREVSAQDRLLATRARVAAKGVTPVTGKGAAERTSIAFAFVGRAT
jgi:hypothetical protein